MSRVDESAGGQDFQEPQEKQAPAGALRRWRPGPRKRWVGAAAAAVVVVGGGAAAVAAHHDFEEEGRASVHAEGRGHDRTRADGRDGEQREGRDDGRDAAGPARAPAPLPSLDAADAVVKASSAVPGGKVESLQPVSVTGGGRAWQAVVLGPDGVRHAVTVDGVTFAITSNTVIGG
ncbi:hypothetical protein K353_04612 [Kitasatospora sp. SolWspMP-SS2h]|uniref:hypothetical protein n=1 Tax=Kitasatospora sp. SolWspMP-SS2h TaxID=1305729 RepID=UPI000DBFB67E|nr:hypothetical protein [Kitasatospora sp. SolWspMP-SS2h]RAJ36784.1 hypothetical protein K353_04612 [Kitasatospora sp. SolWspMP-SS2h]